MAVSELPDPALVDEHHRHAWSKIGAIVEPDLRPVGDPGHVPALADDHVRPGVPVHRDLGKRALQGLDQVVGRLPVRVSGPDVDGFRPADEMLPEPFLVATCQRTVKVFDDVPNALGQDPPVLGRFGPVVRP